MARNSSTKPARAGANFQALFGASAGDGVLSGLKLVSLERISTGAQPRTQFPTSEIEELALSISELRERGEGIEGTGILQPLLVRRTDDADQPYRLVAGERRLRASRQAGLNEVPVIELSASPKIAEDSRESNLLAMQLVENLQRRDLPALDEARAFQQMMDLRGLSQREAAQLLGKSRGYLQNRLDLLHMGEDIQAMVASRESTIRVAAHINRIDELELRAQLIRHVLEDNWSEREVLRHINDADTSTSASTFLDSRESEADGVESQEDPLVSKVASRESKSSQKVPDRASKTLQEVVKALGGALQKLDEPVPASEQKKLRKLAGEAEVVLKAIRERLERSN